ncbi:PTS glucose transporter subunit IIA [Haloimpatiens sp. FM7315]|uniref:PTS sugar transporter subunit IIA n=1 Tax=Haloimpatiens sp. FM7315 TaxID=3298609 RepID=UPI0035A2C933
MLEFIKKNYKLVSPADGKTLELSKVKDKVFSDKLAGDGIAIELQGDIIYSPVDGKLNVIFPTNHAFVITNKAGAEILVHIGIDTVLLKGEGFLRLKEEGENVKIGDPIMKIDKKLIEGKGFSTMTILLVTNLDKFKILSYIVDKEVKAYKDVVLKFSKR